MYFQKKQIPLKFITITAGEGKSAVGYVSPDRIRKQIDVLNRAYSQANIGFTLTDNIQVREENTMIRPERENYYFNPPLPTSTLPSELALSKSLK